MIPLGRTYNYFARGLNEIIVESQEYPDLEIEQRLVLIYDRDFQFYMSKRSGNAGESYRQLLETAIKRAKKSGLIEKLVRKYWGHDIDTLNYDQRTKIYLKTPQ